MSVFCDLFGKVNVKTFKSRVCKCHMYTGYVYLVMMFIFLLSDYKLIPLLSMFCSYKMSETK